jgi:hypothetical protein
VPELDQLRVTIWLLDEEHQVIASTEMMKYEIDLMKMNYLIETIHKPDDRQDHPRQRRYSPSFTRNDNVPRHLAPSSYHATSL